MPFTGPPPGAIAGGRYRFPRLVVGTAGTKVATSDDGGVTWTQRTPAVATIDSYVWAQALGLFVGVGPNVIQTSPDGVTWTSRTSPFGGSSINSVAWSPPLGQLLAVGDSGKMATSPDGITWTLVASPPFGTTTTNEVLWVPYLAKWFVAAASSKLGVSSDGITWALVSGHGFSGTIKTLTCSQSLIIGATTGGGNQIRTSPDGVTWTGRTNPASGGLRAACWSAWLSLFLIGSDTAEIITSPDGITWTSRASATTAFTADGQVQDIVATQGGIVAVGNAGPDSSSVAVVATSPDGITYTTRSHGFGATVTPAKSIAGSQVPFV